MRMRRGGEEELAALADGSLAPEHRAELEARIEASPILADRLAEQERAVALLQGAGDEVEAPAGLRARVDAQRSPRKVRTPRSLALGGVAGRHSGSRCGSGRARRRLRIAGDAIQGRPRANRARARGRRRGDADEDVLGMADPPARDRTSTPRRATASTRPGSGARQACWCRSGRSTRARM